MILRSYSCNALYIYGNVEGEAGREDEEAEENEKMQAGVMRRGNYSIRDEVKQSEEAWQRKLLCEAPGGPTTRQSQHKWGGSVMVESSGGGTEMGVQVVLWWGGLMERNDGAEVMEKSVGER
ncbi:hypothetical protein Pcinc_017716 [Petrolisthes cinctipes]|uniref:Uncharacterized protein n=1 Tax=Petrolisthes cinctipes TaxID=88211 RepID=A0AAE1KMG9_PETCI|nr:hypothetical protein Pcinc_017716 [Petrolisthes cinctipes]